MSNDGIDERMTSEDAGPVPARSQDRGENKSPGVSLGGTVAIEPPRQGLPVRGLPMHNFPAAVAVVADVVLETALDRNPDVWLYRARTVSLLRRYMRLSLEAGRLPSVLGRELFRAKVTSYTSVTFEDRVIFVHDVEVCMERLAAFDQEIIARVVLQEHDHERAARLLHCTRKTIERRLSDLIDEISEEFLRVGLLMEVQSVTPVGLARPV